RQAGSQSLVAGDRHPSRRIRRRASRGGGGGEAGNGARDLSAPGVSRPEAVENVDRSWIERRGFPPFPLKNSERMGHGGMGGTPRAFERSVFGLLLLGGD